MNYLKTVAGYSGVFAILVSVAAIASAIASVFIIAASASFVVLFPVVLVTLPAIKRAKKASESALKSWIVNADAAKYAKEENSL